MVLLSHALDTVDQLSGNLHNLSAERLKVLDDLLKADQAKLPDVIEQAANNVEDLHRQLTLAQQAIENIEGILADPTAYIEFMNQMRMMDDGMRSGAYVFDDRERRGFEKSLEEHYKNMRTLTQDLAKAEEDLAIQREKEYALQEARQRIVEANHVRNLNDAKKLMAEYKMLEQTRVGAIDGTDVAEAMIRTVEVLTGKVSAFGRESVKAQLEAQIAAGETGVMLHQLSAAFEDLGADTSNGRRRTSSLEFNLLNAALKGLETNTQLADAASQRFGMTLDGLKGKANLYPVLSRHHVRGVEGKESGADVWPRGYRGYRAFREGPAGGFDLKRIRRV